MDDRSKGGMRRREGVGVDGGREFRGDRGVGVCVRNGV